MADIIQIILGLGVVISGATFIVMILVTEGIALIKDIKENNYWNRK